MPVSIDIRDVSKRFRIQSDRPNSLKERVVRRGRRRTAGSTPFWALRDITMAIDAGETIGLLGHNGSGKSTLLKLIGGILKPTDGEVRVTGRIASLLELGAGFHPELTGRENVFLNGAILGLSQRQLQARFDDIVEFAELEGFIDTQVRNYSSGMYARLGFAVAVNVDPDVLLIDEVLAVGDESFQRKCLDRVSEFQQQGKTIVIVSHSPDMMRRICDRVAVLDHGQLVAFGVPANAIRTFREHLLEQQVERRARLEAKHHAEHPGDDRSPADETVPPSLAHGAAQEAKRNFKVRIVEVDVEHLNQDTRPYLFPGEPLTVRIRFDAVEPVTDVVFGIGIYDNRDGRDLFGINTELLGRDIGELFGPGEVVFEIEAVPLLDGTYPITVGIHSHDEGTVYDWSEQRHWFEVLNPDRRAGTVAMPVSVKLSVQRPPGDPLGEP